MSATYKPVGEAENADLVVMKAANLEELAEDAEATAAYERSRDQERVPAEIVDRLLAGDSPVKVARVSRPYTARARHPGWIELHLFVAARNLRAQRHNGDNEEARRGARRRPRRCDLMARGSQGGGSRPLAVKVRRA